MSGNPKLLDYFETKIKALLQNKVDKVPGKGLSTEDFTTAEKTKLAGIPEGGGGGGGGTITIDSAMSSTSVNPVQNRVIYAALQEIEPDPMMIDDELDGASEYPVQNKVVYNAINTINTTLTVKNGTLVPASTQQSVNVSNLKIVQYGKIVVMFGFITNVNITSSNTNQTIGTIRDVPAPSTAVRTYCNVGDNAYSIGAVSYLYIGTDGIVIKTSSAGSGKAVYLNAVWVVD